MKNFKVVIKTDRKNCPFKYNPYCDEPKKTCKVNNFKLCTEKNCPFKEKGMTIYVIERKQKRDWYPLSMFPVITTILGMQYDNVSCVRRDYGECVEFFDIIRTAFPYLKFRISEYSRVEKEKP